jgi:hypothetical protein
MKNINILPTDQPSRLHLWTDENGMRLALCELEYSHTRNTQHIYITSDEDIKEDDYCYDNFLKSVFKANSIMGVKTQCTSEKIILSTDPTLIEDGVQEIEDYFLQWFVENPTCEYVEIESWETKGEWNLDYKIIIPKEEPKQVICRDKLDRVIQNGYYVDVQDSGIHKVYRKEDGQLYFKPYGEEERVSSYFSNDLILMSYGSKLIMDLKKEIADKKQEEPKQDFSKEWKELEDDNLCEPLKLWDETSEEVDSLVNELINKFTDWSGSYVYRDKLIEIYEQLKKK